MSTDGGFGVDPVARLKASREKHEKKSQAAREYLTRCVDVATIESYAGDDASTRSPDLVMWSGIGKTWAERFADYDQLQGLASLVATAGVFGGLPPRHDLAVWLFSTLDGMGSRESLNGEPVPVGSRRDPNETYRLWFGGTPPGEEIPTRKIQAWVAGALMFWRSVRDKV